MKEIKVFDDSLSLCCAFVAVTTMYTMYCTLLFVTRSFFTIMLVSVFLLNKCCMCSSFLVMSRFSIHVCCQKYLQYIQPCFQLRLWVQEVGGTLYTTNHSTAQYSYHHNCCYITVVLDYYAPHSVPVPVTMLRVPQGPY